MKGKSQNLSLDNCKIGHFLEGGLRTMERVAFTLAMESTSERYICSVGLACGAIDSRFDPPCVLGC